MFFVSEIIEKAPYCLKSPLQEKVYKLLKKLQIPFERVTTDEAISMEDCFEINQNWM
jgi:Ala-tRNA(Pro) deacylase